jgi:UDP-GlcNAc:undecaprenyl-phosphate/decaprenyl-phosphate GlcNAc-1-phosphate transferase
VSGWFVPLALLAIPLFDLALVIVARLRAGKPVYFGSPDHFAVRLRHHGWRARSIAIVAGALGLAYVSAGIGSTFLPNTGAMGVLVGVVILGLALLVVMLRRFPPRLPPSQPPAS